jgi:hypothetical protein
MGNNERAKMIATFAPLSLTKARNGAMRPPTHSPELDGEGALLLHQICKNIDAISHLSRGRELPLILR